MVCPMSRSSRATSRRTPLRSPEDVLRQPMAARQLLLQRLVQLAQTLNARAKQ